MSKQVYILYLLWILTQLTSTYCLKCFGCFGLSSRFGIWASRTSAPILRCVGSWIRQVKAVKAVVAAMIVMIYSWWMLMNCWWMLMMYDDVWWCWYCISVLFETAGHCGRCFFFWVPSSLHPDIKSLLLESCSKKSKKAPKQQTLMHDGCHNLEVCVLESWCRYLDFVGFQADF